MVVPSSAGTNVISPLEDRKCQDHAVEEQKSKANNLSKHLQLWLQYARLKVDHGWQRQSLNEVEVLYFHRSRQQSHAFSTIPTTRQSTSLTLGPNTEQPISSSCPDSSMSWVHRKPSPANTDDITVPPNSQMTSSECHSSTTCKSLSPYLKEYGSIIQKGLLDQLSSSSTSVPSRGPRIPSSSKTDVTEHQDCVSNSTFQQSDILALSTTLTSTPSYSMHNCPTLPSQPPNVMKDAGILTQHSNASSFAPLTYDSFWSAHQSSTRYFPSTGLDSSNIPVRPSSIMSNALQANQSQYDMRTVPVK